MSDTKTTALSPPELTLLDEVFMHGAQILKDAGWESAQINAFLARPEVKEYVTGLAAEFNTQEILVARTRFMARRRLARLSGASVTMLRNALRGRVYKRHADGSIVLDPETQKPIVLDYEPNPMQVSVAQDVLDRMGVHDKQAMEKGAELSISVLLGVDDRAAVHIRYDDGLKSEQERALSRERVRTAIERLIPKVSEARQRVLDVKGVARKKKKPKKKAKSKSGVKT